jgi:hypothetical protein
LTAVFKALRLAPGDREVAYEAAVVYARLGDNNSALLQAKLALAARSRFWFELPWFDDLRGQADFAQLLQQRRGDD